MPRRRSLPSATHLLLPLLATLVVACGGGGDATADSASAGDSMAVEETADAAGAGGMAARDSIPMEISVTATGGPVKNDGTFTARGMGMRCVHDPNAQAGATNAAWTVVFGSSDTTSGVQMLNLEVGVPTNDTAEAFSLTLVAGTMTAGGMQTPMRYGVVTWPSGLLLGSGKVTVRREGNGARFTVNAVDGNTKTQLAMTITCARLGSVD